ncbi:UDP-N-acetylmuramate dehydrogenase [Alteromonas sp. CYL-A6]|uniref:UDP-N-acetylmuramate dehydrogenase n=1 Tax=Alteromonas nitratireducens TaxID=3390813 RepID=UPI0034C1139B
MPSLKSHHTFALSASCHQLTAFDNAEDFLRANERSTHNYLLGEGSNTVFLEDYNGQVLLNRIKGITYKRSGKGHHLRVGAGENWHALVTRCMENGWYGMENLALIPGSVGAAPIQNIGAYGREVMSFIDSVDIVEKKTGTSRTLSNQECQFGYRDSIFKRELADNCLITHVSFFLPEVYVPETSYGELAVLDNPTPWDIYNEVITIRTRKLPAPEALGNAGSFFKNPVIAASHFDTLKAQHAEIPGYRLSDGSVKVPAAWLIDQLGFKGRVSGGVRCHPTQPLVLTNTGAATGADVITMAKAIINSVKAMYSIVLEPEVRLVGKNGLVTL